MTKRPRYKKLKDVKLPSGEDQRIAKIIDQAEEELEANRVSFRWGKKQLKIVRHAADLMGVPYQTFIKLAVFEHALAILNDAKAVRKLTTEE
jgi:uncharacterized protein (DUF1778 family)